MYFKEGKKHMIKLSKDKDMLRTENKRGQMNQTNTLELAEWYTDKQI